MQLTGAQAIIKCLELEGVEYVFGIPGGVILPTFDALYDSKKLKFILVKHEQGASHMADGYARATGKTGVCMVTSGPGATNTVTGLATAYMDSVPVVCITGQVATHAIGSDAFQEADIVGITRPVTKHNFLVKNAEDLSRIIREAFYIAHSGRPGPVLIDFPVDVSRQTIKFDFPDTIPMRGYEPNQPVSRQEVQNAAELIRAAKRPLLYVGGGVMASEAHRELGSLVKKTGIPVTTTILGLGAFPETHPLSLGMLGMHGTHCANYAVQNSDLLIAVGARFDDRVTGKIDKFAPHAKIIHVDIDPASISKTVKVNLSIVSDAKPVLKVWTQMLTNKRSQIKAWLNQIKTWKEKHPLKYDQTTSQIRVEYVIDQIGKLTQHKAVMVTGVGQHQMWAAQWYKFTQPRTMITSGGLGTMGFGLPAAIGAALGRSKDTVVCVEGDGSFQMTMTELATAAYYKIPVKLVLMDNGYFGMVRQWQQLFYKKRYSASVIGPTNPDFVKIADAYGMFVKSVRKKEEVVPALREILKHKGPAMLHCRVSREDNVYPMVPAGNALDQIIDMA